MDRSIGKNTTATSLNAALVACASLLRCAGEKFWADKIEQLASRGSALTPRDADAILGWFGGMGSLNDLILSAMNGHSVRPEEEASINAELDEIRATIFEQATKLARS